ncbi:MAG: glutamate--tRNA ligase [Clostridia bacterium]|nr:glutamate--tRNA ligase [Clostridia bacterium]
MDYLKLAGLLFPDVKTTPEQLEERYPQRDLPEGAKVTRIAPSPTGFFHIGGLFPATVCERLAHQSGGVFYLRIEDTDSKREVKGAAAFITTILDYYGLHFDEGVTADGDKGAYGPYTQSQRVDIYHVYAKKLVEEGRAYPVFSTDEELDELKALDKKAEIKSVNWEQDAEARREAMLKRRQFTMEQVEKELAAGHKFALFAIADGNPENKIKVTDLVKGLLEIPENDEDVVLLKSDGIPTYHFAHAVDDHLMRTTHVIRGEEWLPSLSKHLMLFRYLGFKPPKYMHIAQLMRLDENGNKKKFSKRDMGANLEDYRKMGYCVDAVNEYVMTLLNSNYEEWHTQNPDKDRLDFPFSIKKMSVSGCLFDTEKLNDVSKNVISKMTAAQVYDGVCDFAKTEDTEFYETLRSDRAYAESILAIGRGGAKPRKDFATWADVKPYMSFFYDKYFTRDDEMPQDKDKADIKAALKKFIDTCDENDDQSCWFEKLKDIAEQIGYARETKLYKKEPEKYKGHVGDVASFVRIAITGRQNSPDLYEVIKILGRQRTSDRIKESIALL